MPHSTRVLILAAVARCRCGKRLGYFEHHMSRWACSRKLFEPAEPGLHDAVDMVYDKNHQPIEPHLRLECEHDTLRIDGICPLCEPFHLARRGA